MDITRWSTPKSDWLYSLQPKMENSLQSAKTRPGSDCGSGHEPPYWQMQTETEESGENHYTILHYTRYDLNQIPYDYTVEVINRFKGLDLIECLMNYGWRFMTLYRRQKSRLSQRKRNAKKHNGCLRRPCK